MVKILSPFRHAARLAVEVPCGLAACLVAALATSVPCRASVPVPSPMPSTLQAPPSGLSPAETAAVDAIGAASVAGRGAPGLTIEIERGGAVVYAKGFGYANVEDAVAATPETRYPIGSNTKQFTATAILLLQDEGKLSIDDPLAKYLPQIPHARSVTIRDLLTHAGGYAEFTAAADFDELGNRPATPAEVVGTVVAKPLAFKPGTKREYSNTGFELLLMVIERVSGMSYRDFLARKIFGPLGMTGTYVRDSDDTMPLVATEYATYALGPWEHALHIDYTWLGGAGAIVSDASDLFKWNAALDGGKLLSKTSLHEMMTPAKIAGPSFADYGFGIETPTLPNGRRAILHGGNTTGAATQDARFPDDDLEIVVLANSGTYDYTGAVNALYAVLAKPSPAASPAPSPAASASPAAATPKPKAPPAGVVRAERWLDDAIAGKIAFSRLRPVMRANLSHEHLAALRALAALGPRTYTLAGIDRRPPATGYEFLLDTPKAHLIYLFLVDDDGLVAQVAVIERTAFAPPAGPHS
jgi:CubicO group peptidase (beta-lactamase class C family)